MTREQCAKCTYVTRCNSILRFESRTLGMVCQQDRAKAATKPKPKVPKKAKDVVTTPAASYVVAIDPAVDKCTPQK